MKTIPEFRLVAEPLTPEAKSLTPFKWADADVGRRHRLGGQPSSWMSANWPICADCGQPMTFYGQLDSISEEIVIADVGVICVFLCFDCFRAHAVVDTS